MKTTNRFKPAVISRWVFKDAPIPEENSVVDEAVVVAGAEVVVAAAVVEATLGAGVLRWLTPIPVLGATVAPRLAPPVIPGVVLRAVTRTAVEDTAAEEVEG